MNGALDSGSESGGDIVISGGTVIAAGSSGMAENFSANSTQCSVFFVTEEAFSAGDTAVITDAEGNVLMEYTLRTEGNSVVFSCPGLEEGVTVTLTAGDVSCEGEAAFGGESAGGVSAGFGGPGGFGRGEAGPWGGDRRNIDSSTGR